MTGAMEVGVKVHVVAFQVLLHDGVVAFGITSADHQSSVGEHGPAVVLEPEPL